jgi:RNA polymerase sigma factor (sigma-70 family)
MIGQVRRLLHRRSGCTLTDVQLLDDFVARRDEASFDVLVWRHGAMVLSLCQRVLHDTHEAEDAFQATFLVLARKAGSIGKRESAGSWLYKVALRIALRVRARALKRTALAEPLDELPGRDDPEDPVWRDLRPVLDEEIDRLPEKYRAPFVLCYLEGHTNEEAAEKIGCPMGTILSRLARGRERLRSRLAGRGLTLSAAGLSAVLSQNAAAAVPAALVSFTVEAALPFAAGQAATGLVSGSVAALTEGVLHAMLLTKVKTTTAALLALAVLGTGFGSVSTRLLAQRAAPGERKPAIERPRDAGGRGGRAPEKPPQFTGRVAGVAGDGKSFTVEVPAATRGEAPQKVDIKLTDKSQVVYSNVGPDGAKPTEGYQVRVWTGEGAKDVAVEAVLMGNAPDLFRRRPEVSGRVAKVSPDGKMLTFSIPARGRGDDATPEKTINVEITDKTVVAYNYIGRGGAKPTEGYDAEVWLERGSMDKAGRVHFLGHEERPARGAVNVDKEPDRAGRVIAAAPDGKTFTLEVPGKNRGDAPTKWEVKVDDKTRFLLRNVGPDGDKPVVGSVVQVWLADGSQDTAAKVSITGAPRERDVLLSGKVVAIAKDGQGLTLEAAGARGRGEPVKKVDIKFTDKTNLIYHGVGTGGAKLTEGYHAQVWLEEGSMDTAAQIYLGSGTRGRR